MKHLSIAWKMREIAELLELLGENSFKVRAYQQAATNLEQLTADLEDLWRQGQLTEIPGVGRSIASQIEEVLSTGESTYLKELRQKAPFSQLLDIPGIGPRMARTLNESLGITNITELIAALEAKKVRELPGMNSRTENNLIKSIQQIGAEDGTILLGMALPIARELISRLQVVHGVQEIWIVGSARRYVEAVSDIDLLVNTTQPENVLKVLTTMPECRKVLTSGSNRAIIRTRQGIRVELITVQPEDFPLTLFMTTGKEHVRQVEELAIEQGYTCNYDHWLDVHGQKMVFASEEEIYQTLGISYVIPELREGQGEVQAAKEGWLPRSVNLEQIKGDLHLHTRWSDGVNTIEEMVNKGRSLGYTYMAICDHSRSLKIAKGMSIEMLLEQLKAIDELNSKLDGFRLLKGIEVDILKDGGLDYPDEVLAQLDIVVASLHTGFNATQEEITGRMIQAMHNPYVDVIAHPTGRLIHRRKAYAIDLEQIILAAKETGTILEVNATPDRLDLSAEHLKLCKVHGVMIAINSDAHSVGQMDYMEYGVGMARRGWIEDKDVINTYTLDELLSLLKKDIKSSVRSKEFGV